MKVGTWYTVFEETLQNNGMPPNPTEFNPAPFTWPTDGKIKPPVIGGDQKVLTDPCGTRSGSASCQTDFDRAYRRHTRRAPY